MAKTKAELETAHRLYQGTMCKVQRAQEDGDYPGAVKHAVSSWKYIDDMLQYERRYLDRAEFASIESIDCVLQYAPLFFDFQSLDKLETLLKTTRRVEKSITSDTVQSLIEARDLMQNAHRLWNYLEHQALSEPHDPRSIFSGDDSDWHRIVTVWEGLGLIQRLNDGNRCCLKLSEFAEEEVRGKCPSCGVVGTGPKSQFLEEQQCPVCQGIVDIVLLPKL